STDPAMWIIQVTSPHRALPIWADDYVESVRDYVQMNDKVKVKILSVDEPGNKIRLSIRQAQPDWDPSKSQRPRRRERRGSSSFEDRKSTRLNSSHVKISYAVFS